MMKILLVVVCVGAWLNLAISLLESRTEAEAFGRLASVGASLDTTITSLEGAQSVADSILKTCKIRKTC